MEVTIKSIIGLRFWLSGFGGFSSEFYDFTLKHYGNTIKIIKIISPKISMVFSSRCK
jgi:hypothetical protein